MADSDESQKLSLPFGDVIKRLAVAIHSQLQNVLHNMRIQSPELRTQSLLAFISRSKRKLAQLLAITRWLDMPGVAQFFTSMSQLQLKISSRENRLNENQDALYFTHSQLFSRRIRTLDVVSAKDILARGTYPHLPASIFSSEMPMEDVLESNDAAETALRKSLDIYLRSKLALGDAVPSDIDFSSIEKGVLKLRVTNMYELLLTLDHLDTSSPWNVLRLKLCVVSHPQESFHSVQNLSGVENDILLVLRRIAEGPLLQISAAKPLESQVATASSSASSSSATASSSSESGLIGNNDTLGINPNDTIGSDVCNSTINNTQNRALLPRFHTICQHTAYATALRYLYVQALETSRTIWSGLCQADFQEKRFYSQFVFRFWRSRNTGYYQYELRVIQLRSPTQTYVPLDEEIVCVDSDGEEVGGDVGLTADIRETKKEKTTNFNQNQSSDSSSSADNSLKPAHLILELWTCSAPDDSEGSLRITRRRVLGKNIPCHSPELPLRNNFKNQNQKDLGSVGLFDITEFITNGVTFCSMFHKVLELCATNRLWVLHSRVMKSPGVSHALSSGQTGLALVLQPLRLTISVKCAEMIVFVDYLSGTFSVGSNQLSDVAKGASKDCSLFLSEINNVESERLAGAVHASVSVSLSSVSTEILHMNSTMSASSSSSSSASAFSSSSSSSNNNNSSSSSSSSSGDDYTASLYLLPLSTSTNMIQYLSAAFWSRIMRKALCVDNVELYAHTLYNAARTLCAGVHTNKSNSNGELNENRNDQNGLLNGAGMSPGNIIPLVYDVCSWPLDPRNQPNISKDLASNSHTNIAAALRAVTHADTTPTVITPSLQEELENVTKKYSQNNENSTELSAKTDLTGNTEFSYFSLIMCMVVDMSLQPHIYAILCGIFPGSTVFLPPKALKAKMVPFDVTKCTHNSQNLILDDDACDRMIEKAIETSVNWAECCMIGAPDLRDFGLFIPAPASDVAVTQRLVSTSALTSEPCIIVLWTDAVSLIAIQFNSCGTDVDNEKEKEKGKENGKKNGEDKEKMASSNGKRKNINYADVSTMQVSLLCPIPLPGVGTLGVSGPPRCVIGVPRSVTSEEANRLKRRCISIGEISLTVTRDVLSASTANSSFADLGTPTKKRRRSESALYSFRCGKLACIDTFTAMSGLEQSDLYAALGQEIVQHCLNKYPFPAPFPSTLKSPLGISMSNGDTDALSSLSSAYCTCRPLLEFILLITNSPSPHSGLTSNGTGPGTGGGTGTKGRLQLLALDCTSRSEAFITCALYENCPKSDGDKDKDNKDNGSDSDSKVNPPSASLRLVGYVEVETSRSLVPVTDIPDTPKTRRDSASFDYDQAPSVTIDEPVKHTEKVNLRLSSLTSLFEDQIVEMDAFRECFQKKLQAMGGRNPFHAFINKLIALSVPKIST